jgi:phage-related minor tail protein
MELTTLSFKVDTKELEGVIGTLDKVATSVKNLNQAQKATEVAQKKATKSTEEAAAATEKLNKAQKSTEKSTKKTQSVLERQKDILDFMTQGYSRGQSSTLAMAKASGTLTSEIRELGEVLQVQRRLIGGDPFDKSTSGLLALTNQYTELKEAVRQYNVDSGVTAKQARELARDKERIIERMKVEGASFGDIKNAIRLHNEAYVQAAANVNRLTQEEKEIIRVQKEHTNAIRALTKEEERMEAVLASLSANYNQNIGSARKAGEEEARYARNLKLSGVSAEEASAKLALYRKQQSLIAAEEEKRQIQYLQRGLQPQIGDVAVSLASGQNLLTVMLQQGDQIRGLIAQTGVQGAALQKAMRDAMSGTVDSIKMTAGAMVSLLGGAIESTAKSLAGLVTGPFTALWAAMRMSAKEGTTTADAIRNGLMSSLAGLKTLAFGAAGAMIALAVAFVQTQKQQDELSKSLILTGANLGLSTMGALELAESMEVLGVSSSKSIDIITAFAKEGAGNMYQMQSIIPAVAEAMKHLGVSAEDMAKQYKAISKDPVAALTELGIKTGLVTAETVNMVNELVQSGERTKAVAAAIEAANKVYLTAAKDMQREYSLLGEIFNATGNYFKNLWDGIKSLTYKDSAAEKLKKEYEEVNARIVEVKENLKSNASIGIKGDPALLNQLTAQSEALREQLTLLEKASAAEAKNRAEVSAKNKANEVALGINKQLADDTDKMLSKQLKLNEYIDWYVKKKKEDANQKAQGAGDLLNLEALKEAARLEWERSKAAKESRKETEKLSVKYEGDLQRLNDLRENAIGKTFQLTRAEVEYNKILSSPVYKKYSDEQKAALETAKEAAHFQERGSVILKESLALRDKYKKEDTARNDLSFKYQESQQKELQNLELQNAQLEFRTSLLGMEAVEAAKATVEFEKQLKLTQAKNEYDLERNRILKEYADLARSTGRPDLVGEMNALNGALQNYLKKVGIVNKEAASGLADIYIKEFEKIGASLNDTFKGSFTKSADRLRNLFSGDNLSGLNSFINGLSSITDIFADINVQQETFNKLREEAAGDEKSLGRIIAKQKEAELKSYGDITGAAKKFFKEGSLGYKALHKVEAAFRAYEMAMAVKTAAVKIAENAGVVMSFIMGEESRAVASVAASNTSSAAALVEGQSKAVTAVATQGSGDPYTAFGRIAAMAAIMAALGFAVSGSMSGSGPAPSNQGTGTVFGDSSAQSASLLNSIDALTEVDTMTMRYSAKMLEALNNIESNIGGLTNLVLRTNGGDLTSGSSFGIETGTKVPFLNSAELNLTMLGGIIAGPIGAVVGGIVSKIPVVQKITSALFGTKTKVNGTGLSMQDQSLASIINQGANLQNYADVTKTKKVFGITYKTSTSTQYSQADQTLADQFTKIFQGFNDAILAAAGPLGLNLDEVKNRLDNFVVSIGKIDLKDMTGEQVQEKLIAVFGAAADKISQYAIPGLEKFQEVGEGYLETLVRVAYNVETVRTSFERLGFSVESLNVDSAMEFLGFFEDLGSMNTILGEFYQNFYSETERTANSVAQITKVMKELGLEMPTSRLEYRAQIEKAMAEGNEELAATLLKMSSAVAEVLPEIAEMVDGVEGLSETMKSLKSEQMNLNIQLLEAQGNTEAATAAFRELATTGMTEMEIALWDANRAIEKQISDLNAKNNLEKQLLQIQGNTTALRELELKTLSPANQELQKLIWNLDDSAKSAALLAQQEKARADERYGLETQLLQVQGNTTELRARELAKLDPANRALQELIWSLQDQATAATEASRIATELAAKQEQINSERYGLETQLLNLQGNTTELRARELALLDPSNRALQELIWSLQDQAEAADLAAKAAADLAAEQSRIASERYSLETQLLQLQGNTAKLKERELALLDPSNRALQEQIWAQEAANAAAEASAKAAAEAAAEAARAQADAVRAAEELKAAWQSVTDSIFEEVNRIRNLAGGDSVMSLAVAQRNFDAANAAAKSGDQEAAKTLPELSQKLLELATLQASSTAELRRFQLLTAAALESTGSTLVGQYGLVVPAFAEGGNYSGGMALVGEDGPELINFNKSGRIHSASDTASILNNGSAIALLERLNDNIENLRYEVRADVQHNAKTAKLLDRVIKDGENVSVVFDTAQPVTVV